MAYLLSNICICIRMASWPQYTNVTYRRRGQTTVRYWYRYLLSLWRLRSGITW